MAAPAPSASAADARHVKLQRFLVMKAYNLRKGKQSLAQQFQPLQQLDAASQRAVLPLDALCAYLSVPPFRRVLLLQVLALPSDARAVDLEVFLRFLQTAAVQGAREEQALRAADPELPLPPPPSPSPREASALVVFAPSLLSMRFAHPPPAPGLWKKREITIQERITEYTKIDEHGQAQHLVEKEKHQTEVIHMESLDGEFAHREITHFEQLEQLNGEVVHHDQGREEFVHLKSQHDEVSRFESSIPAHMGGAGRPEECEQAPPSPTIKRDPSSMPDDAASGLAGLQSPKRGGLEPQDDADGEQPPEEAEYQGEYYMPQNN
ncbi:hypothetical protein P43SY_009743 [Pythium insidiosum]|uniref:Uncharacterized protein n=1 Tax=Pythium insidiosum TaxID=114742 RepID=A0AAD5LC92_PYTIN|nr:hypothetical protein P43SY_009743 [Pythium insidiosum]